MSQVRLLVPPQREYTGQSRILARAFPSDVPAYLLMAAGRIVGTERVADEALTSTDHKDDSEATHGEYRRKSKQAERMDHGGGSAPSRLVFPQTLPRRDDANIR